MPPRLIFAAITLDATLLIYCAILPMPPRCLMPLFATLPRYARSVLLFDAC